MINNNNHIVKAGNLVRIKTTNKKWDMYYCVSSARMLRVENNTLGLVIKIDRNSLSNYHEVLIGKDIVGILELHLEKV